MRRRGLNSSLVTDGSIAVLLINKIVKFETMNYNNYIEIVPEKRFGRPCIKGTRISVYDILNWLANGMTKTEIIEDFPELSEDQINACLAFAADREHRLRAAS